MLLGESILSSVHGLDRHRCDRGYSGVHPQCSARAVLSTNQISTHSKGAVSLAEGDLFDEAATDAVRDLWSI